MIKSDPAKLSECLNANAESSRFLHFIFQEFESGFIELGKINKTGLKLDGYYQYMGLPLMYDKPDKAKSEGQNREDYSWSFSPAPRLWEVPKSKHSSNANIGRISCLWADFNYDKMPGGIIESIERINSLPLKPSVTINSEDSRQILYVMGDSLKTSELLLWKEWINVLQLYSNSSEINISDHLPLPGTLKHKNGASFKVQVCDEQSSWTRYSREEMAQLQIDTKKLVQNNQSINSSSKIIDFASREVCLPLREQLESRKVPKKVVEAIFSASFDSDAASKLGKPQNRFETDLWISENLLKCNFSRAEVKSILSAKQSGKNFSQTKTGKHDLSLENLIDEAAKLIGSNPANSKLDHFGSTHLMPPGYELNEDSSVWLIEQFQKEGKPPKTVFVSSSPLRITAIRENIDNGQIAVTISFNYLDKTRTTTLLRSHMCNTRSLVNILSSEGAPVNSNNARQLVAYLAAYEHEFADLIPRIQVTSRFGRGRSGKKFFLPGLSSSVQFAPAGTGDSSIYNAYSARRGGLISWINAMNRLEEGNYIIPQIAVIAAFIPPLQKILQIPNFILDIYGNTSSGKSTTLRLAASVYGRPYDPDSLINQWMNTKSAVEQLAGMCSELPIFLDDAQHCSDDLKRSVIYMIANGKGKGRGAGGTGGMQETLSWHTVALSTSEEPLHQSSPHEGVRGRLLPIGGLVSPFPANSGAVVQSFDKAIQNTHGYAGETYIRHLNGWNDKDWAKWRKRYSMLRGELATSSSSDIIGRVSGYIAAIGVTAEIVCPLFTLNFKPDVLVAWLLNHIQEQQYDQNLVILALRALGEHYLSNLSSFAGTEQFQVPKGKSLQGISKRGQYIGFMRTTLDAVFSKRRWNQTMLLNKLSEAGVLIATENDRHTKKVTVEGINYRLICVKWSAILPDDLL